MPGPTASERAACLIPKNNEQLTGGNKTTREGSHKATIPQVLYFTNIITEITGNFIVGVSKEAKFQVMTVSGNKRV